MARRNPADSQRAPGPGADQPTARDRARLGALLPDILPAAIAWAESLERAAVATGRPLSGTQRALAADVGVRHPQRIRLVFTERLPAPDDRRLRAAIARAGLLGPDMAGATFGYAVLLCRGLDLPAVLAHEFRHVQQYERFGSIAGLLPIYLRQIVEVGYWDAPLEVDARAHEEKAVGLRRGWRWQFPPRTPR